MIKNVEFENYRNLNGKYIFSNTLNVIIGKNNSGKTNILDGIRLAFSTITNDYFKISKSDFKNSDDSNPIVIKVELKYNSIPSFNFPELDSKNTCGFMVTIKKTQSSRYVKEVALLNGSSISTDIIREDFQIPNVYGIPLIRVEDIYTDGLTTGISNFINSEEKYRELKSESKSAIKKELETKTNKFKDLCNKFNQNLDIELTDPKISNERIYIVDGELEHNFKIGSGYKSIANIILNTLNENYNIILIDELENHLHPALIRTLIRELRSIENTLIIATTHSPVVINELEIEEIVDVSSKLLSSIGPTNVKKLNTFLHPGRNELMLADNIVLVEGYTEEILLKSYLKGKNNNWTVINVAGVMFEPYIELAYLLEKKVVVVSDNDKAISKTKVNSGRFNKLETLCKRKKIKILEVENTLETDLYNNNYLNDFKFLLKKHNKNPEFFVAKDKKKTLIAEKLVEAKVDLSNWHIIKGIEDEFESN